MIIWTMLIGISLVVWFTMWALQYYYAKRACLARYSALGDGAWDSGDVFFHGVIGAFFPPVFLLIVLSDYQSDKEKIDDFWRKKEENSPGKSSSKDAHNQLIKKYNAATNQLENLQKDYINLIERSGSLEEENKKLKALVESIDRFDFMDLE